MRSSCPCRALAPTKRRSEPEGQQFADLLQLDQLEEEAPTPPAQPIRPAPQPVGTSCSLTVAGICQQARWLFCMLPAACCARLRILEVSLFCPSCKAMTAVSGLTGFCNCLLARWRSQSMHGTAPLSEIFGAELRAVHICWTLCCHLSQPAMPPSSLTATSLCQRQRQAVAAIIAQRNLLCTLY